MRFGRVARVYLAANSGFARLRPTSMTTPKHLYFACLIVAAPVVDDPSCNALQPCATPGTPQMSLAGTGSLHDRQEDVLAQNERGIFIHSVEGHDPMRPCRPFGRAVTKRWPRTPRPRPMCGSLSRRMTRQVTRRRVHTVTTPSTRSS